MTERKPHGMTFRSWIDQQIDEAAQRGAFDNLSGAGKPLPRRGEDEDYGQAWLLDYAHREGVATEDLLPTPLKLRRESHLLGETVQTLPSEKQVRDVVADLNERIMQWRRIPLGPPIFVPLVDADAMVSRWHAGQQASASASAGHREEDAPAASALRPWWRRRVSRRPGRS